MGFCYMRHNDNTASVCNRYDDTRRLTLSLSPLSPSYVYLAISHLVFQFLFNGAVARSGSVLLLLLFCTYLFRFVCVTIVYLPIFILLSPLLHILCVYLLSLAQFQSRKFSDGVFPKTNRRCSRNAHCHYEHTNTYHTCTLTHQKYYFSVIQH